MSQEIHALRFEADAVAPTGKTRLTITISRPYVGEKGDWACLFELRGIPDEEERREYYGVDALQALVLNLFYLRSVFLRLKKAGFSFCDVLSGQKIFPEETFDVFTAKA
jgi:hypothetical protein